MTEPRMTPVSTLLRRMQEAEAERIKGFLKEAKVRIDPQTGTIRRPVPVVPGSHKSIQRDPLTINKAGEQQ